ncbi:MAG: tetratricopeptide repeat protein [Candidatus Omnitrophica bacterium]|nr:tetratricopeptide repeat protein [Candidatus Omnitrophota bacterium]
MILKVAMMKTTGLQKIGLFFFALGISLLILEGGLRLGGWVFISLQEKGNQSNVAAGKEYRILCLGESTTALGGEQAYPRQLERILNSRQSLTKFKVINKGIPATTTDQIVAKVESYIDDYQPQMVVAMMGINDPQNLVKRNWREKVSRYSKAFKLFDMIAAHLAQKRKEATSDFVEQQITKLEKQAVANSSLRVAVEIAKANLYRSANRPQQEKDAILKALSTDEKSAQAWQLLGIYYVRHAEYEKALESLQKAYDFGSAVVKISSLERIAQAYKLLNDSEKAEKIYRDILMHWPRHPQANGALGDILLEQGKYEEAVKLYLQQLDIDPQEVAVYGKLAHCYRRLGQVQKIDQIFGLGVKVNAENPEILYEWGYSLLENKKYAQAEKVFWEALRLNKKDQRGVNEKIYERLRECYQSQSKTDQLEQLNKLLRRKSEEYNPGTQKNYLQLAKILAKYRIPLIAVQYPKRSVAPLAAMLLSAPQEVMLVDNQQVFEEALKESSYDDLFSDRFAGDFGHCTPKGNAVLAEHVAEKILQELKVLPNSIGRIENNVTKINW